MTPNDHHSAPERWPPHRAIIIILIVGLISFIPPKDAQNGPPRKGMLRFAVGVRCQTGKA